MSDDIRSTIAGVNEKIETNTSNIGIIHDTIRRIERRSEAAEKRLEEKIDRLSNGNQRTSTSSSVSTGDDSVFRDGSGDSGFKRNDDDTKAE